MMSTFLLSLIFSSCATKSTAVGENPAPVSEESAVENQTNLVEGEVATERAETEPTADADGTPKYVTGKNGKQYLELKIKQVTILKKKIPKYPYKAKKEGPKESACLVKFLVNESGNTDEIEIVDCLDIFHKSVQDVRNDWNFEPFAQEGNAVPFVFTLRIRFQLQ